MKLYLAADHAGFGLKESVKERLMALGYEVEDCTPDFAEGDDYPDAVAPCAKKVAQEPEAMGIIFGASGQGEAMAANRIPGVRAAVYYGEPGRTQHDAQGNELSLLESVRAHNHANMLSLGVRFLSEREAQDAVERFLSHRVSDDPRHLRRIEKLG